MYNELIDFTKCEIDLSANYGGSDKKRGILLDEKRYMLKLSDRVPEEKRNNLNSSYTNSALSEYICCHILKSMGFDVQNTLLGTIDLISSKNELKTYPVVACENFLSKGEYLVEFKFIEGAILDRKPPKTPILSDIYDTIYPPNAYFSKEFGQQAIERYWNTFIMDALFGNFDRHANNWGYIVNDKKEINLAPIYDCGSCLYPQIAEDSLDMIINTPSEIKKRIDVFPKAALIDETKEKVSYKEFILSGKNQDCTNALLYIYPKINFNKISQIIEDTPGITPKRKEFFNVMMRERYNQILTPAYQLFKNNENDMNFAQEYSER